MFHQHGDDWMLERLQPPVNRPVAVVLDTDTYNEVDDQFALAYAALSPAIDLQAVYAAPYLNDRSVSPADGMEKSYHEIQHILSLTEGKGSRPVFFRGSDRFMEAAGKPVKSEAAEDLIRRALDRPMDSPLYVATIGCPVNVASALQMEPAIAEKIVVVWLGGNARWWKDTREFNLMQDVYASQVLFDSGVPMVRFPGYNVVTHLHTSPAELDYFLGDSEGLGRYLCDIVKDYTLSHSKTTVRSKIIWDVVTIAWLINPVIATTVIDHAPVLNENCTFSLDDSRHLTCEAVMLDRDAIFMDLFRTLGSKRA